MTERRLGVYTQIMTESYKAQANLKGKAPPRDPPTIDWLREKHGFWVEETLDGIVQGDMEIQAGAIVSLLARKHFGPTFRLRDFLVELLQDEIVEAWMEKQH